jgi:signal transduction histidine kinase
MDAVVESARETLGTPPAELVVEESFGDFEANEERLQTLLENLLRNAVDHAGEDVTVRVGPFADRAGFFLADDGPGIDSEDRKDVFKRGYSTGGDGTGLGLAIVENIIGAHDWEIGVTESEAGGARFEIELAPAASV